MVAKLIEIGCVEFCCVGPQAERLHDSLDEIIEDRGAFEIVTTWHLDELDACEYFLLAAGGGAPTLVALVATHADLADLLDTHAASA